MSGGEDLGVRRIVYKELKDGDYRKLQAQSNDADTGGGARDLRLPFTAFDPIMGKLLPETREVSRRRDGVPSSAIVRYGPVLLDPDDATSRTAEMVWETPTDARPTEGRIARVHDSEATRRLLEIRDPDMGRVFLLLVQNNAGNLRVHYAYEKQLRDGLWSEEIAKPILTHLDDLSRNQNNAVQGYVDLVDGTVYHHGLT